MSLNYNYNYMDKIDNLLVKLENDDMYHETSCILGAFLGDSLGSYVEFQKGPELFQYVNFDYINQIWGTSPGQLTDDSEMALCSAYALLDGLLDDGCYINKNRFAFYYGLWLLSEPFDIGNTTKNSLNGVYDLKLCHNEYKTNLKGYEISLHNYIYSEKLYDVIEKKSFALNYNSLSNGFLMRKTPIAIYNLLLNEVSDVGEKIHLTDEKMSKKLNELDNLITHSNKITHECSHIYTLIISRYIYLKKINYIGDYYESILKYLENHIQSIKSENKKIFDDLLECIKYGRPKDFKFDPSTFYKNMGYFMYSLCLCLKYLNDYKTGYNYSYAKIMEEVIDYGGDTDTNAAIVGGVIGCITGYNSFNDKWLYKMLYFNANKGSRKRPFIFSPGLVLIYLDELSQCRKRNESRKIIIKEDNKNYRPRALCLLIKFLLRKK